MYRAPVKDACFILRELIGEDGLQACPAHAEYSLDLAEAVLEEAAKLAENVLDPQYRAADKAGARWTAEGVRAPEGFHDAYRQYVEGGWSSLRAAPEHGGQGMPCVLGTAVEEFWAASNLAFKLCPMLTQGAVEALEHFGSPAQKDRFLPKMVSGEWTGTMNLTEPQAGSDLAAIRTRAAPDGEHYRLFGQKIYITWGDHDLTPNTIHMVLARIDGAPPGVRGISMFIVPKVMVEADGSLGARNDLQCLSIEHKLGINGSPTCVMAYGQQDGAVGYLVGEANRGLEYMFVMMNAARLSVGLEGYAVADRAFQQAASWARTRVQGKPPGALAGVTGPAPIIHHPDVKRMLMTMRAYTEGCRAMALVAAAAQDAAHAHPDAEVRKQNQAFYEFMVPLIKGYSTEMSLEVTSLGVQVHGGMGFIEETGAAQYYRDAKILTIYEGTTAIQANDLVGRKTSRDGGATARSIAAQIQATESLLAARRSDAARAMLKRLSAARLALLDVVDFVAGQTRSSPNAVFAGSVPYLMLAGNVIAGWQMARALLVAEDRLAEGVETDFMRAKISTARFYADHLLSKATGLRDSIVEGSAGVTEMALDAF